MVSHSPFSAFGKEGRLICLLRFKNEAGKTVTAALIRNLFIFRFRVSYFFLLIPLFLNSFK
jgi:hypothetical protein